VQCFLLWYVVTVAVWWILGAIIAPNRMLAYATAVGTFVYVTYSYFSNLIALRNQVIQHLQEKILGELLKLIRKTPADQMFKSMEKKASEIGFSGDEVTESAAMDIDPKGGHRGQAAAVTVSSGLLMDVNSGDAETRQAAIEQLSVALQLPQVILQLTLALMHKRPSDVEAAVAGAFRAMSIPAKFNPLGVQLIFQSLRLPVSATDVAHSFYQLAPAKYYGLLLSHDDTIMSLVHVAMDSHHDVSKLVKVVSHVALAQLSKQLDIPFTTLEHMYLFCDALYGRDRPAALRHAAEVLVALKPQLPEEPLQVRPAVQLIIEALFMANGLRHSFKEAGVALIRTTQLRQNLIFKTMLPLIDPSAGLTSIDSEAVGGIGDEVGGDDDDAIDEVVGSVDASAALLNAARARDPLTIAGSIASQVIKLVQSRFGMSTDQWNTLRSLLVLLRGDSVKLKSFDRVFHRATPQETYKIALTVLAAQKTIMVDRAAIRAQLGVYHGVNIAELPDDLISDTEGFAGFLRHKGVPGPLTKLVVKLQTNVLRQENQFEAKFLRQQDLKHDGMKDTLEMWLADQWNAMSALFTLAPALPEEWCRYDILEEQMGVPQDGLRVVRRTVAVIMKLLQEVFADVNFAEVHRDFVHLRAAGSDTAEDDLARFLEAPLYEGCPITVQKLFAVVSEAARFAFRQFNFEEKVAGAAAIKKTRAKRANNEVTRLALKLANLTKTDDRIAFDEDFAFTIGAVIGKRVESMYDVQEDKTASMMVASLTQKSLNVMRVREEVNMRAGVGPSGGGDDGDEFSESEAEADGAVNGNPMDASGKETPPPAGAEKTKHKRRKSRKKSVALDEDDGLTEAQKKALALSFEAKIAEELLSVASLIAEPGDHAKEIAGSVLELTAILCRHQKFQRIAACGIKIDVANQLFEFFDDLVGFWMTGKLRPLDADAIGQFFGLDGEAVLALTNPLTLVQKYDELDGIRLLVQALTRSPRLSERSSRAYVQKLLDTDAEKVLFRPLMQALGMRGQRTSTLRRRVMWHCTLGSHFSHHHTCLTAVTTLPTEGQRKVAEHVMALGELRDLYLTAAHHSDRREEVNLIRIAFAQQMREVMLATRERAEQRQLAGIATVTPSPRTKGAIAAARRREAKGGPAAGAPANASFAGPGAEEVLEFGHVIGDLMEAWQHFGSIAAYLTALHKRLAALPDVADAQAAAAPQVRQLFALMKGVTPRAFARIQAAAASDIPRVATLPFIGASHQLLIDLLEDTSSHPIVQRFVKVNIDIMLASMRKLAKARRESVLNPLTEEGTFGDATEEGAEEPTSPASEPESPTHVVERQRLFACRTAFEGMSPFLLLDAAVGPDVRSLFGVLHGVHRWYPSDVPHGFSAVVTCMVQGCRTKLGTLQILSSLFPIKYRGLVLELLRVARGDATTPLLAIADACGAPVAPMRSLRRFLAPTLNPLQQIDFVINDTASVTRRHDEEEARLGRLKPVALTDANEADVILNWCALLRDAARGDMMSLLRHDAFINLNSTSVAMLTTTSDTAQQMLCDLFPQYPSLANMTAGGMDDPLGFGDNAFPDQPDTSEYAADAFAKALPELYSAMMAVAPALRDPMHLAVGTLHLMNSDFARASLAFEAIDPYNAKHVVTVRMCIIIGRLIHNDGAVDDPGALTRVVSGILEILPDLFGDSSDLVAREVFAAAHPALAEFLLHVAPYISKMVNEQLVDNLDGSGPAAGSQSGATPGSMKRQSSRQSTGGSLMFGIVSSSFDINHISSQAEQAADAFNHLLPLLVEDARYAGLAREAAPLVTLALHTVAEIIAKHPTLDVVMDALILIMREAVGLQRKGVELAASQAVRASDSALHTAASGHHDSFVSKLAAVEELLDRAGEFVGEVKYLLSDDHTRGPKLFIGLLEMVVEAGADVHSQEEADDSLSVEDHNKIRLILSLAQGKFECLAQLIQHTGVLVPAGIVGQLQGVLRTLSTMQNLSKGTATITANDALELVSAQIFAEVDVGQTGHLSFSEFQLALKRMRLNIPDHEARVWFDQLDLDDSETITLAEFQTTIKTVRQKFQHMLLDTLALSKENIYLLTIWTAVLVLMLLVFIILGAAAFSDGSTFSAVITGAMPTMGMLINQIQTPGGWSTLVGGVDRTVEVFFDRIAGNDKKK
jgi:hypothetical protein